MAVEHEHTVFHTQKLFSSADTQEYTALLPRSLLQACNSLFQGAALSWVISLPRSQPRTISLEHSVCHILVQAMARDRSTTCREEVYTRRVLTYMCHVVSPAGSGTFTTTGTFTTMLTSLEMPTDHERGAQAVKLLCRDTVNQILCRAANSCRCMAASLPVSCMAVSMQASPSLH